MAAAHAGARLDSVFAAFPDAKSQTKAEYVTDVTGDIDSLLAIFYVLLALAVIVSLFGIVNTLVLSTFERTRELGMPRAVGMSKRQVRRMVRHESIITALIGAGLGIGDGGPASFAFASRTAAATPRLATLLADITRDERVMAAESAPGTVFAPACPSPQPARTSATITLVTWAVFCTPR